MKINREKIKASFAEIKRKALITIKRNPQYIPLSMLLIGFLVYSLNLTVISNTTAKLQGQGMGLCGFASMLFSLLSLLCLLNAFPKRQRPNILMILVMFVMFGCMFYADYTYITRILEKTTGTNPTIKITQATSYITDAKNVMITHMVFLGLTSVCVFLEPLFAKLLRKINTSVEVEENARIESLDLTEE